MAQVRQSFRPLSPIHSPVRAVPETIRSRLSPTHESQNALNGKTNDRPQQQRGRSPLRAIHPENSDSSSIRPEQPVIHRRGERVKSDGTSLTSLNPSNLSTQQANRDGQEPSVPARSSANLHSLPTRDQPIDSSKVTRQFQQTGEELSDVPTLDDDDALPIISMTGRNLPVYSRFPFDVTFLPQTMETNVEDNIHRLRLRLIDSDLQHQRRTSEEYLKRTHETIPSSSSRSREQFAYHPRPATNTLSQQRVTPRNVLRQPSFSVLPNQTSALTGTHSRLSRGRMGMDYEPLVNPDADRDLEIRALPDWLPVTRTPNPSLIVSNYSYDPRLHSQPVNLLERQYTSSNMDDLIDSMARRQLASRRYDSSIDRSRFSGRSYAPYYESGLMPRQTSVYNQHRYDDLYLINETQMPTTQIDSNLIRPYLNEMNPTARSRFDSSHRSLPDFEHVNIDHSLRRNSYSKLPPITPNNENHRVDRSNVPINSALYRARENRSETRNQPLTSIPMNIPDHAEHFIELPSDIYLSSRTGAPFTIEALGSSHRPQDTNRRTETRPSTQTKSGASLDSEIDQSDQDKKPVNDRPSTNPTQETYQENSLNNDQAGFFTDEKKSPELPPPNRRRLFRKVANGIIFLLFAQRKAVQTRLTIPRQTTSAVIHKIRLQEILVAVHRVYLEPEGPIYNSIIDVINSPIDLKEALNSSALNYHIANQTIGDALKNIISRVVDFMPRDGILGVTKTSLLAALIQNGNPFPDNYFWRCEKLLLEFDKSKIINISKQRAILLMIGILILRGLVTTLLIKPIKYRVILGKLNPNQAGNCKTIASVMFYLGRSAAGLNSQILPMPQEWEKCVYNDTDLQPIVQHTEVKPILLKCELSLRLWCEEYIRRIDNSFDRQLRV